MKIGTDQYNTFDTMTMDCWNDRVYYEGKEFPAGHFGAEILNFAGAIHDPLLERITVLTALVDDLSTAEKSKRHDIAAQLNRCCVTQFHGCILVLRFAIAKAKVHMRILNML